jgi:hypothetical protein
VVAVSFYQANVVLEELDFNLTKETKDILNKINNPYN